MTTPQEAIDRLQTLRRRADTFKEHAEICLTALVGASLLFIVLGVLAGALFFLLLLVSAWIGQMILRDVFIETPAAQAIWFSCPHCAKKLSTQVVWRCGYCDFENPEPTMCFNGSILSSCQQCAGKVASLQCPHCLLFIQVEKPGDNPHAAVVRGIAPSVSAVSKVGQDSLKRAERTKLEEQMHEQAMRSLNREAEIDKAKAKRARAAKNLAAATEDKDGERAHLDAVVKELSSIEARENAIRQFLKDRQQTIHADADLSDEEKNDLLDILQEMVAQVRSRYL